MTTTMMAQRGQPGLETQIHLAARTKRVRFNEFFKDFDRLRTGEISGIGLFQFHVLLLLGGCLLLCRDEGLDPQGFLSPVQFQFHLFQSVFI